MINIILFIIGLYFVVTYFKTIIGAALIIGSILLGIFTYNNWDSLDQKSPYLKALSGLLAVVLLFSGAGFMLSNADSNTKTTSSVPTKIKTLEEQEAEKKAKEEEDEKAAEAREKEKEEEEKEKEELAATEAVEDEKNENEDKKDAAKVEVKHDLAIHYIDVGQGDAILIKLPNGEISLIDAGPGANSANLLAYLKKQGIGKIDYLIATHPHEDHIGGMADVIKNHTIGDIYLPNKTHTTKTFENMLNAIKDKNLKFKVAQDGVKIIDSENLKYEILSPAEGYSDDNLNNHSVVTKLTFGNNKFLSTGDAESPIENSIANKDIKADVIKVGHHGSKTSTTDTFLTAAKPSAAVISCGKDNQYGHPHNEVIDRLRANKVDIYRTDLQGTIVITSDGEKIKFNKDANPKNENAPPKEEKKATTTNNSGGGSGDKEKPTIVEKETDGSYKYMGNKNSKKLHYTSCGSAKKTKESNRVYFKTREEAINQGYVPCKNCTP